MINKILIRTSDRKTLHKDRRSLGMNGENLQEVLLFCLDEKIKGNGIVEVELPDGTKGMIEVDRTEEGYELPVKSSLLSQTGFVKFQLRILHDDVEIFKSEIIALEVKDSINATASIPEEYPSWVDVLENLKQDLEKSESERVSNENKRQSAEKTRQENFTKIQETVSNAISNIKDLTEEYNSNAKKETKKFNDNAVDQTKTFNDNSDSKLAEYNKNHTDKIKEYGDNAKAKLDEYNENDADKTNAYNDNTVLKEKAFNDIVTESTEAFNTNVEQKETELEDLAEKKINEYNQVSAELTAKVEQVQTENEALKAENKLIKEQIPSASMSGNSIHVEDSGSLDFDWKIKSGHKQESREGYNLINTNKDIIKSVNSGVTWNGNSYVVDGLTVTWEFDKNDLLLSVHIKGTATEGTNIHIDKRVRTYSAGTYTIYQDGMFVENIGWFRNDTSVSTRTFDEEWTTTVNSIYIALGETIDRTYTPMLLKGTYTVDNIPTYEQYGASPSPDYPSEVETVGNNANLLNNTLQSQTINGLKVTVNTDKSVTVVGTATDATPLIFDQSKATLPAGTYTVKDCSTFVESEENHGSWNSGETRTFTAEATLSNSGFYKYYASGEEVNVTLYPKVEKGTVATPYSPHGMGSVETDVVNKNIMPIVNLGTSWEYTERGIKSFGKNKGTDITKFYIKKGQTIKIGLKLLSQSTVDTTFTWYVDNVPGSIPSFGRIQNLKLNQVYERSYTADKDCEIKGTRWGDEVSDIFEFQLWAEIDNLTNYIKHQSQTAIMPIQQEMLEGDYVSNVEHHEWKKLVLTGDEEWTKGYDSERTNGFRAEIEELRKIDKTQNYVLCGALCNYLKESLFFTNDISKEVWGNLNTFALSLSAQYTLALNIGNINTVEELKSFLKAKYDEGNPVTVYYKLAEPLNLELTAEQKAIRDTKLYTYKNITNISVDNELASIEVEYKKDLDAEHNKLQAEDNNLQSQIDEIKQLLSTTQTSALLLDNLQKDVESEVE